MGYLFGKKVTELKFGIAPGSHVAHILKDEENGTELFTAEVPESGYEPVSQEEIYTNESERRTGQFFKDLARQAELDYNREDADPEVKTLMTHLRDYLTASGRREQQQALKLFNTRKQKIELTIRKNAAAYADKKDELTNQDREYLNVCGNTLGLLKRYDEIFSAQMNGNLQVDWHETNIEEPSDVTIGRVHSWKKTDDVLFPHIPSPNDVKQGVGLFDCFVLTVLSRKAATDPQSIMDMMKDNGDGTVSVKFYAKDYNNEKPEPVIVTVNKTVNQDAFGHNSYASGSLWVQMFEKAYAKYNNLYVTPRCFEMAEDENKTIANARATQEENKNWASVADKALSEKMKSAYDQAKEAEKIAKKAMARYKAEGEKYASGMNSLWVGFSDAVLNAIEPHKYEQAILPGEASKIYEQDKSGKYINHPDYYLPEEKELYELLDESVNRNHAVLTVIPERLKQAGRKSETTDAGLHPGHIYAINKVFKKDGKMFVQVRDPYAMFSAKYEDGKLQSDSHIISGTCNGGIDNMGTFNLEIKDFCKHFENITGIENKTAVKFNQLAFFKMRHYDFDPLTDYEKTHELPLRYEAKKFADDYSQWKRKMNNEKIPADQKPAKPVFDNKGIELDEITAQELYKSINVQNKAEIVNIFETAFGRGPAPEIQNAENQQQAEIAQPQQPERNHNKPEEVNQIAEAVANQQEYNQNAEQEWYAHLNRELSNPARLTKLAVQLKQTVADLKSTDEFFVLTNSKEFNRMRDSLYELSKNVDTLSEGKVSDTDALRKQIVEKMQTLEIEAGVYMERKQASIISDISAGKIPSDRAMLRLAAAMSTANLCGLKEPLSAWPGKKAEQIKLVENDIKAKLSRPQDLSVEQYNKLRDIAKSFDDRNKLIKPEAEKKSRDAGKVL